MGVLFIIDASFYFYLAVVDCDGDQYILFKPPSLRSSIPSYPVPLNQHFFIPLFFLDFEIFFKSAQPLLAQPLLRNTLNPDPYVGGNFRREPDET